MAEWGEPEPIPIPDEIGRWHSIKDGVILWWKHLHGESDEYEYWQLDDDGNERFNENVNDEVHYSLYEVEVRLKTDLTTGDTEVLSFNYGGKVYKPI
jgi:hypothetical protein